MRQTARCLRTAIEPNLIHTYIEPRVREQEFGNLQGDEFKAFRAEQMRVGRFFYRFPTGESGADVYGRHGQRGRLGGATAGHHGLLWLHLKAWDGPPPSGGEAERPLSVSDPAGRPWSWRPAAPTPPHRCRNV